MFLQLLNINYIISIFTNLKYIQLMKNENIYTKSVVCLASNVHMTTNICWMLLIWIRCTLNRIAKFNVFCAQDSDTKMPASAWKEGGELLLQNKWQVSFEKGSF